MKTSKAAAAEVGYHKHTKSSYSTKSKSKLHVGRISLQSLSDSLPQVTPHHSPIRQNDPKTKDFLEMMGYTKKSSKTNLKSVFCLDKDIQKIALTDLIGPKHYSYLKERGFLQTFMDCKKKEEQKKNLHQKNSISYASIIHTDIIREYNVKHEKNEVKKSEFLGFKRFIKKKSGNIDIIDGICEKCDLLVEEFKGKEKMMRRELLARSQRIGEEIECARWGNRLKKKGKNEN